MKWEIHPGVGVGNLAFGAERQEVESILGLPEKIAPDDVGGKQTLAWYYWSKGISAHFDEEDNYCLSGLEVDNRKIKLNGEKYIGLTKEQLLEKAQRENWSEIDIDDEGWYVIVGSLALTFWIEENEVESIQCYMFLDDNGDEIWPPK